MVKTKTKTKITPQKNPTTNKTHLWASYKILTSDLKTPADGN